MTTSYNLDIQNKLKLDTAKSFYHVDDLSAIPDKKFERVLYYFKSGDIEENIISKTLNVCLPGGLILFCNIPEINKRLSNGVVKENKEYLTEVFDSAGIKYFWFFRGKEEHLFECLVEVK